MGILIRAGLVEAEKRGRWMFYRRKEATLARLAASITKAV
jgi:DNA-binding transcriptional ArsR family regulator